MSTASIEKERVVAAAQAAIEAARTDYQNAITELAEEWEDMGWWGRWRYRSSHTASVLLEAARHELRVAHLNNLLLLCEETEASTIQLSGRDAETLFG